MNNALQSLGNTVKNFSVFVSSLLSVQVCILYQL